MNEREFQRFLPKVDKTEGCWIWIASVTNKGYGQMSIGGRAGQPQLAHRLSYEHFVGPIPDGLELDHLCRNTRCVNPEHLEAVTHEENCRRGEQGAYLKKKTHCTNGHEFTPENTYRRKDGRQCRRCAIDRATARNRRLSARDARASGDSQRPKGQAARSGTPVRP